MIPPITCRSILSPLLTLLLLCLTGGLGLAVVLSLLAGSHWRLELLRHFPQQMALGLSLTLLACVLLRRRRLAFLAGLLLLPPLAQLTYYYVPRQFSSEPAALRVVSFNVLRDNRNHEKVLSYLRSAEADVIAVIEADDHWVDALAPLQESHPYVTQLPRSHNFGLALYSKFPVVRYRRPMPTPGHLLLVAELDCRGSLLTVVVAHPVPPMNRDTARLRNTYLDRCAEEVAKLPGPLLLMGDFNATPWSPAFKTLLTRTGLQDSGRGRGFQSTWNRYNPLFSIPIDHVFHSRELRPVARRIGPSCGSDHSPVVVDFAFSPTLPAPPEAQRSRRLAPAPPKPAEIPPAPPEPAPTNKAPRVRRVPNPPGQP